MSRVNARRRLLIAALTLLPLAAGALGLASAHRSGSGVPNPPLIATINVGEAIKGLDEYKAMQAEFKKRAEQFQEELKTKRTSIEDDQKRHDTMPTGAPKKALAQKMIRDALQLKFDSEYATQFMDQMEGELLRELGERVAAVVKELAQTNKYTLVMADDSERRPARGGANEVMGSILSKRLWYVDPDHDVTKELIDMMNNQFAAGAKTGVAQP
jgi:Skp family chaperone for outer membrane proteins